MISVMGMTAPTAANTPKLTDRLGIGILTRVVPRDLVDEVLAETARKEKRSRLLPARVVVYYVMALTLFYGDAYEEVMRRLVGGLKLMRSWNGEWTVPTTSAISQARARLGEEPLKELFARVGRPIASPGSTGSWYHGLRVMAVDGVVIDVPDTPANADTFGRSTNDKAPSPFPQVRIVGLAECGTRAVIAAAVGPLASYERALMTELLPRLSPGTLVLADRGYYSHDLWLRARDTGADLLWRVKNDIWFPVLKRLPDGSYLSKALSKQVKADLRKGWRRHPTPEEAPDVRIVEYTIDNRDDKAEVICLVTSIVDHELAPATELAALYHERWEFELALDEIQTHQLGRPRVLRSKSPEMVRQEIWALLLTHYAIRHLIYEASDTIDIDPDRISFMRTLRLVRRHTTDQAAFSPLPADPCDM